MKNVEEDKKKTNRMKEWKNKWCDGVNQQQKKCITIRSFEAIPVFYIMYKFMEISCALLFPSRNYHI